MLVGSRGIGIGAAEGRAEAIEGRFKTTRGGGASGGCKAAEGARSPKDGKAA